jgi:hypothetical protein
MNALAHESPPRNRNCPPSEDIFLLAEHYIIIVATLQSRENMLPEIEPGSFQVSKETS